MAIEPNADKSSIFHPKKERKAERLGRRSGVGWGGVGEGRYVSLGGKIRSVIHIAVAKEAES
jgi:hypothetical protein